MATIEVSIKDVVLPPALANAALLIAAPSLGCLITYTRALSDLCRAYSLPVPDLAHVLQYSPKPPSSATSTKTDECQEAARGTTVFQEPNDKIKREYVEPELDAVKHELTEEYKDMYMVGNQKTPVISEAHSGIPLLHDGQQSNNQGTSHKTNEDTCYILKEKIPVKPPNVLDGSSSGKIKTLISILNSDGELKYVDSLEEANTISHCRMPVKYLQGNIKPTDGVISVHTVLENRTISSILYINSKEGTVLEFPFTHIREISSWKHNCIRINYYSSQDSQPKQFVIQSQATKTSKGKVRSDSVNNTRILNWLHNFHG